MKKTLLIISFLIPFALHAQTKVVIGLKASGLIAMNDINTDVKGLVVEPNSFGVRYSVGPVLDIMLTDNYAFHTGLWFTAKRSGHILQQTQDFAKTELQYVQLPIAMKFYTDELIDNFRLYFIVGVTADLKVSELTSFENKITGNKEKESTSSYFNTFDIGILASAGAEYKIGDRTALFGGFTYNRGLIPSQFEAVAKTATGNTNYVIKSQLSLFSLDIGIRF